MQGEPGGWHQLDFANGVFGHGVLRSEPEVLVDLAMVNGHDAFGRPNHEEPRGEASQGSTLGDHVFGSRRLPMGPGDEVVLADVESDFLPGLANRSLTSGRQLIRPHLVRIDPTAGEHPHSSEGDLGVAAEHEHLEPSGVVSQEEYGGGGDQLFTVGHTSDHIGEFCPSQDAGPRWPSPRIASTYSEGVLRRAVPVLVAVAAGAVVAFGLGWVLGAFDANDGRSGAAPTQGLSGDSAGEQPSPRAELDLAEFLDRWDASLVGPYVVSGTLTRTRGVTDPHTVEESADFRVARRDGRVLDQLGEFAVVTSDGMQRDCQIFGPDEVACTEPIAAPTPSEERASLEQELANYLVYEHADDSCLELVARGPSNFGRWGQSSVVCFDEATGAVASVETFRGDRRSIRVAAATSVDPSQEDLEPGW